ncbi:hypothetical protein ATR1_123d0001, partial [Acetobacter tropicalis]
DLFAQMAEEYEVLMEQIRELDAEISQKGCTSG